MVPSMSNAASRRLESPPVDLQDVRSATTVAALKKRGKLWRLEKARGLLLAVYRGRYVQYRQAKVAVCTRRSGSRLCERSASSVVSVVESADEKVQTPALYANGGTLHMPKRHRGCLDEREYLQY